MNGTCLTPGTTQNVFIPACTAAPKYYAIRFKDDVNNISLISNNTPAIRGTGAPSCSSCGGGGGGELPPKAVAVPVTLSLDGGGPNPVSEIAALQMAIPEDRRSEAYELLVFDVAGRRVRTLQRGLAEPGRRAVTWDLRDESGRNVPAGIYMCA